MIGMNTSQFSYWKIVMNAKQFDDDEPDKKDTGEKKSRVLSSEKSDSESTYTYWTKEQMRRAKPISRKLPPKKMENDREEN